MSAGSSGTGRGRGRPARATGTSLNRTAIVRKALDIAGAEGFAALTMHRLARELDVTPRALYNHVHDRQEVVDGVAALMMQELPEPALDPDDWRSSLRETYRKAREAYRRFPRALLISLDETVTAGEVSPKRILLAEDMLRFFVDIGLSLEQAIAVRGAFLIDVFGFVITIDYRYDTSGEEVREAITQPVPSVWLAARAEVPAPLSHQAASLPASSSDAMFETFIDLRIRAIETLLAPETPGTDHIGR